MAHPRSRQRVERGRAILRGEAADDRAGGPDEQRDHRPVGIDRRQEARVERDLRRLAARGGGAVPGRATGLEVDEPDRLLDHGDPVDPAMHRTRDARDRNAAGKRHLGPRVGPEQHREVGIVEKTQGLRRGGRALPGIEAGRAGGDEGLGGGRPALGGEARQVLQQGVDEHAAAARRRVALVFEPGPRDVEAMADPEWLRQVVESLLDNAFRHAAGLGRGTVALEPGTTPRGPAAIVTVTDDGPGFGAGEEVLFERFRRGDRPGESGFGIGLALARWIVEQHAGAIALGAGPGGTGARIRLELPALDAADAGRARSPGQPSPGQKDDAA